MVLLVYVGALIYGHDRTPQALNNDVAEESLRALYLVEGPHFEVLTFSVGNSAETLYLYLLGIVEHILGPTTAAIRFTSSCLSLLCIWLVYRLVRRADPSIPYWIPILAGAGSLWLFHYASTGLRAISAPVFLCLFAIWLDRTEESSSQKDAWICGAMLGLSIYAYTATRVLPVAFVGYALYRIYRQADARALLARRYGVILAGAGLASIPNLLILLQHPKEFLSRGSYIYHWGTHADRTIHLIASVIFPFYYPEYYRHSRGPTYDFDAISAGLTQPGHNPIHIFLAAALLIGVWNMKQFRGRPVIHFLIAVWIVAMLALGTAGPSLTRLLLLWPAYIAFAALGLGIVVRQRHWLRVPVLALLIFAGVSDAYSYLDRAQRPSLEYSYYFNPAATAIGRGALTLSTGGKRVLCIVSRDANVVRLLAHRGGKLVRVLETAQPDLEPSDLLLREFAPQFLLVEKNPAFQSLVSRFPQGLVTDEDPGFYTIRLPARNETACNNRKARSGHRTDLTAVASLSPKPR